MNLDETARRINNIRQLEELEQRPAAPYDPSESMDNLEEAKSYIRFLYAQVQEYKESTKRMQDSLDEIKDELKETNRRLDAKSESYDRLMESFVSLTSDLKDANRRVQDLTRTLDTKQGQLDRVNKALYGTSKSQKGIERKTESRGQNDDRDDFDGTDGSLSSPSSSSEPASKNTPEPSDTENKAVYHGPDRKGWKYNKQVVGTPIEHRCDRSKLPEGTVILKVMKPKVVRDIICNIQEHHFERLKVKYPDGKIATVYLPEDEDKDAYIYNEIVPHTGVTVNLLSYLLFNRYQMATPAYREAKSRLADMEWNTCRQNLLNWADQGAIQLNQLIPALKEVALQKGANVNVDETWCRYQTHFGHRKTYMWCLVNRKAGIVIFFYEDTTDENGNRKAGGRGRSVLKDFLGEAEIKSLQSDGYNVYMYLDDELLDVDHLCCLAHSRAKLKDAFDQGCDEAGYLIKEIGKLYKREDRYRELGLSPEEIKQMRNDSYTNEVVWNIRRRLNRLLESGEEHVSDMMWRALNYLHKFWDNIFAYRKDGEYTIDNLAAERAIRPMTVQRKNSLFYCSVQGAKNSAIYNTFIETCKQVGISFREYFRRVILELKSGRTDYENLLPMTINLKNQ